MKFKKKKNYLTSFCIIQYKFKWLNDEINGARGEECVRETGLYIFFKILRCRKTSNKPQPQPKKSFLQISPRRINRMEPLFEGSIIAG